MKRLTRCIAAAFATALLPLALTASPALAAPAPADPTNAMPDSLTQTQRQQIEERAAITTRSTSGPKGCVPFLGNPFNNSGQLPLGLAAPNWGRSGWYSRPIVERKDLPKSVNFRENTEGFNQRMDFALRDGSLFARFQDEPQWRSVETPSCLDGHIAAFSVNDSLLTAVDENGWVYSLSNILSSPTQWGWIRAWGSPIWFGKGLQLFNTANQQWSLSLIDNQTDKTYRTVDGKDQPISLAMCTQIVEMTADHRRLVSHDPWLKNDRSFEISTPVDSRFMPTAVSSSGSVHFVIGSHGDMYTRMWDYDISGADVAQFRYTWKDQPQAPSPATWLQGKIGLHTAAIKLPLADWQHQPKIVGKITDKITILSTAPGSQNRELRVEGARGNQTGYFHKMLNDLTWKFTPTGEPLTGKVLPNNPNVDTTNLDLAEPSNVNFTGNLGSALVTVPNFAYQHTSQDIVLEAGGQKFPARLHKVDGRLKEALSMLTPTRTEGLTQTPRYYDAAIELTPEQMQDPALAPFVSGFMKGERVHELYLSATDTTLSVINDHAPLIALGLGRNVSTLTRSYAPVSQNS